MGGPIAQARLNLFSIKHYYCSLQLLSSAALVSCSCQLLPSEAAALISCPVSCSRQLLSSAVLVYLLPKVPKALW